MYPQMSIHPQQFKPPLDLPALPAGKTSARANPADYGFDFDEAELTGGMHAGILGHPDRDPAPVSGEEFENIFQWFLS